MTRKPDPAEIELQLSERRFILESLQTVAQLLQVPLVTAGVWFYISRTNPVMGALNKAILTAELAPIVGDIKLPRGRPPWALLWSPPRTCLTSWKVTSSGVLRRGRRRRKKSARTAGEYCSDGQY